MILKFPRKSYNILKIFCGKSSFGRMFNCIKYFKENFYPFEHFFVVGKVRLNYCSIALKFQRKNFVHWNIFFVEMFIRTKVH